MAKAVEPDRRNASMKSLLARIEAETPPGAQTHEKTAGERAVEALRAELEAAEQRRPEHRTGYPRPLAGSEPNVFQTRLRRAEPHHFPVPATRHVDYVQELETYDEPTEDRDLPPLLGRPVMLAAAAFASAIVTAGLFWLFLGPKDGSKVATAARETAVIRSVDTKIVTAEVAAPQAQPAPAARVPETPPPVPIIVPEPKLTAPPPAVTALAAVPNLANAAPPVPPSATAVRLQVDQAFAVRTGTRVALPIRLDPPNATDPGTRVVLRGLPPNAVIPQATRGPAGSIMLPAEALAAGVLDVTGAKAGETEIEIELQGPGNQVLDRTTAMLAIVPAAVAPAPSPPPQVRPEPQANARGDAMLSRGRALFASGDVAGARLMLERAAESGSAAAALVLGETYDPSTLAARGVRGMTPDIRQARVWYERARTLGVSEADERLRRLPQQ
jgi:hypothetical protein